MFNVKVEGLNIQFTFHHSTKLTGATIGGRPIQAATTCTLRINGQLAAGMAACSASDVFEKERGRKLSLARAIADARKRIDLSYTVRQAIWDRYFMRGFTNSEFHIEACEGMPELSGTLDPQYNGRVDVG